MTFREAAEAQRGIPRLADDNTLVCPGSRGHVFEYSHCNYAMYYTNEPDWKPQAWTHTKKQALALGFTISQDGDTEGVLLFEGNPEQWAYALRRVGHNRSPRFSDKHRAYLKGRMEGRNEVSPFFARRTEQKANEQRTGAEHG